MRRHTRHFKRRAVLTQTPSIDTDPIEPAGAPESAGPADPARHHGPIGTYGPIGTSVISAQAQRGAARSGRVRHRSIAGHRGRGVGQDQHTCPSRRAFAGARRRSASHPVANVFAPRRQRDDAPCEPHRHQRARQPQRHRAGPDVGGHVSQRGARLLRDYADLVGLSPSFTINNHEDSADLMNLVATNWGCRQRKSAFRPSPPALPFTRAS